MAKLPEDKKEEVKKRIKDKVQKYWKKDFKKIVPNPEKRAKIYQDAWALRENNQNFSKIPNDVLIDFLISKIGHWSPTGKGHKQKRFLASKV